MGTILRSHVVCSTELFLRVNYLKKKKPKQTKNVILRTSLKANKKENLYTMTFFQNQELRFPTMLL